MRLYWCVRADIIQIVLENIDLSLYENNPSGRYKFTLFYLRCNRFSRKCSDSLNETGKEILIGIIESLRSSIKQCNHPLLQISISKAGLCRIVIMHASVINSCNKVPFIIFAINAIQF